MAVAQDVDRDVHVSYMDLDLRTAAGVKMLDHRLVRAVKLVCPDSAGSIDLTYRQIVQRCRAAKGAEVAQQRRRVLLEARSGTVASAVP